MYSEIQLQSAIKHIENLDSQCKKLESQIKKTLDTFNVTGLQSLVILLEEMQRPQFCYEDFQTDMSTQFSNHDLFVAFYENILGADIYGDIHLKDGEYLDDDDLEIEAEEVKQRFEFLENQLDDIEGCYIQMGDGSEYFFVESTYLDDVFDERVREFIEGEVVSQLDFAYQHYFDVDSMLDDIKMNDGFGIHLAPYDSEHHEIENYHVFRCN